MTETATLIATLARQLPGDVPWLLRETDDGTARVLVGAQVGNIRGTLDGQGYNVREADVPVRDGWKTLLEVSQ